MVRLLAASCSTFSLGNGCQSQSQSRVGTASLSVALRGWCVGAGSAPKQRAAVVTCLVPKWRLLLFRASPSLGMGSRFARVGEVKEAWFVQLRCSVA
jgi:hypothetical protein